MITGTALFNKITALIKDSMRHNMQPYNKQLHLLNTVCLRCIHSPFVSITIPSIKIELFLYQFSGLHGRQRLKQN